ncbi:pilus assembly protein PilP [Myxococcota bacterium]|nr:pilus assembly protein PilP [Myxococcota bacterium]
MRKWILGGLLVGLVVGSGCDRPNPNAPSVQDYEKQRAEVLKNSGRKMASRATRGPKARDGQPDRGLGVSSGQLGYDAAGRRDPFRSFVADQKLQASETERGPLEQFDLSQLTVVAVVWGTGRPRALLEDPSGRGYVVQVGTAVGKNDGSVTSIDDSAVVVRETYVDYLGEQTSKEIEMRTRSMTQGG